MRRLALSLSAALYLTALAPAARAAEADPKALALQARAVFKKYCIECHHGEGSEGGNFDVLRVATLTVKRERKPPLVVPGKSAESYLYAEKLAKGKMPPDYIRDKDQRPTEADIATIKNWIDAGAPEAPAAEKRTFVSQKVVQIAIRDHLRAAGKEQVKFLRFFTLTHLYNNPRVPDGDLPVYRAALSKAINSLSWKSDIVVPKAVDKEQTVFVIDVRDLDWDKGNLWREILKEYPYGLSYGNHSDPEMRKLQDEINERANCELVDVRADWFIATATRPPLYNTLLRLPKNARDLEKALKVDFETNFLNDKLARAGFITSGVSGQNRLVERHAALHGAYWKSYDFKKENERDDLLRFPLGPHFAKNPYRDQAFVHDGGEIIFHLPNQLNGYLLVDGKDNRIDAGPIAVVSDPLKTSGTNEIVAGLSCMACHKHGVFPLPKDVIRDGKAVFGEADKKVRRLYPEQAEMDKLAKKDTERFLKALEEAAGPFLKVGADKDKPITDFTEPVGEIARLYRLVDLDLTMVACELDLEDPKVLLTKLGEKKVKELKLGSLLKEGGVIKRAEWERVGATSQLQRVARELERGTPLKLQ
jgi:serine/threonine-protein kinase